jgi:hypothetical protein
VDGRHSEWEWTVKRYAIFGGHEYYPSGGMKDFIASSDDLSWSEGFARGWCADSLRWAHVADTRTSEIVFEARSEK